MAQPRATLARGQNHGRVVKNLTAQPQVLKTGHCKAGSSFVTRCMEFPPTTPVLEEAAGCAARATSSIAIQAQGEMA